MKSVLRHGSAIGRSSRATTLGGPTRRPRATGRFAPWFLALLAVFASGDRAFALGESSRSTLEEYCFQCHGSDKIKGDVNLASLSRRGAMGADFKTWELVLEMLEAGEMPPEDEPRPTDGERDRLLDDLRLSLQQARMMSEGDPGNVELRRLTRAEYGYSIEDLTGLRLDFSQMLPEDSVGGEGFANFGAAQFLHGAGLERYLEAAKMVADRAVIGAGPLRFYMDPGMSGQELSAIHRIREIYREWGFRSGSGEGGEAFGLEKYPRVFYATWKYLHRDALGMGDVSLDEFARREGVSARFAQSIWSTLSAENPSFPTSEIVEAWRALPVPSELNPEDREVVLREGCQEIYETLFRWQLAFAGASNDDEEAPSLSESSFEARPRHDFRTNLNWARDSKTAKLSMSARPVGFEPDGAIRVLWRDARIQFRGPDRRFGAPRSLREVLAEADARELEFVSEDREGENDFYMAAPRDLALTYRIPEGATSARLSVAVELVDGDASDPVVRVELSDGRSEQETAASKGDLSALLGGADSARVRSWAEGIRDFARRLPQSSHREPAPSDRDPIPAPFDNRYNTAERNLFHYRIKYHRDDDFIYRRILDDEARRQLDAAWVDLFTSFDYYEVYLQFIAEKFGIEWDEDESSLRAFSETPDSVRHIVERLNRERQRARDALRGAESEHLTQFIALAETAWRRPLDDEEVAALREYYASLRRDFDKDHPSALRATLARVLVSPNFLYRLEKSERDVDVTPLDDWELASRLSYFLWSSIPDEELRDLAEKGMLQEPDTLARQARRMLRDSKARRFAIEFFGQWFGVYRFDEYNGIDTSRFHEFTPELKASMHEEAIALFEHITRADRPVSEVLFADYGFLNETLATHYGIPDLDLAEGEWTRVDGLHRYQRGGLLRLGATLAVTSAPLRTSPVKRGDWILRRVVDDPVPPPPPDAGSIPADDVLSDGLTLRERLEAHRRDPSCIKCHERMDPYGFALESYDPIGRWRAAYRDGQRVDARAVLKSGDDVDGPEGLIEHLKTREEEFVRTFCEKLLGYALGRTEAIADASLISEMVGESNDVSARRISEIVASLVSSRQFRYRRNQSPQPSLDTESVAHED